MANENQLTPEIREKLREQGLGYLDSSVAEIAYAKFAKDIGYGKPVLEDVQNYVYLDARKDGEWARYLDAESMKELVKTNSTIGREPFTGSVNIHDDYIMDACAGRFGITVNLVKVKDLVKRMGGEEKIEPRYNEMYLDELAKENEEAYKRLISGFQIYQVKKMVAETSNKGAEVAKKSGLEKILTQETPVA